MKGIKLSFYLTGPILKPEFCINDNKEQKLINLGTVNWSNEMITVDLLTDRYNHKLLLSGETFIDKHPDLKFKINFHKRHLPILKSQIQKCTRRSKIDIGVKTAISMILIEDKGDAIRQIGLFELLRRLTIIIVEDAVLCESYAFVMWCMAILTKGHALNGYCIEKILEITKGVISSGFRDPGAYSIEINEVNLPKLIKRNIGRPEIISLLFRSCYNGMEGDTRMLLTAAVTWTARYRLNSPTLQYIKTVCPLPIDRYDQLQKDEIQSESLDFHCTDIVSRIKKYIEMDDKKIENLIWSNESSVTDRINIRPARTNSIHVNKDWRSVKLIYQMETKKLTYEL
jgi:hypothetical protein